MNPAIAVLRAERDRLQRHLDEMLENVKHARAHLRSFDEALFVLEGSANGESSGDTAAHAPGYKPPLKVLVREILQEFPGQSPTEIADRLALRGRLTDINTVLGTLSRARREGIIHKRGRVWFDGAGNAASDDVESDDSESEEAPGSPEASVNAGREAELEDHGAVTSTQAAQHPTANRESVGSKPTTSAPTHRDREKFLAGSTLSNANRNPQFIGPRR